MKGWETSVDEQNIDKALWIIFFEAIKNACTPYVRCIVHCKTSPAALQQFLQTMLQLPISCKLLACCLQESFYSPISKAKAKFGA